MAGERTVIRELVTLLGFDIDEKQLKEFDDKIISIRKNLRRMAIAAGIVGGVLTAIVVKTVRAGESIAQISRRLQISTQALQEWREVFVRVGVTIPTVDTAIQRLAKNAGLAATGVSTEMVSAFAALNLELKDAEGNLKSIDVLLPEFLDALAAEDDKLRLSKAVKILDTEGAALLQVFDDTNVSLAEQRARVVALGGVMSSQLIKKSEEAGNSWKDLGSALNGVIFSIGEDLLPVVIDMLNGLAQWIADNRELIALVTKLTLGVVAFSAVVFGAIAATAIWNLHLVVLNATVGALLLKFLLIPALVLAIVAAMALLAEDISVGISGSSTRSVTGDLLKSLPAFWHQVKTGFFNFMGAIWKRLITIKTWLLGIPALLEKEFSAMLDRMEARYNWIKNAILGVTEGVVVPNPSGVDPSANALDAAIRVAASGIGPPAEARSQEINFNITAAPGQTPESIGDVVARKLVGVGVVTGGGLAK